MQRGNRICAYVLAIALIPTLAVAASKARQEYLEALRSKPDVERGAQLFETCAVCHNPRGGGTTDGNVPRIAGQHFKVLVKQLVDFRHGQRWDVRMENFTDQHVIQGAQEVADVAAYVSSLDLPSNRGVGPGEIVDRGAAVYRARCQSCHGAEGEGNESRLVPRLAGQHYEYLLRQMYDGADGRRPNLSRKHVRLLKRLERDDFVGVADYLSRMGWSATPAPMRLAD